MGTLKAGLGDPARTVFTVAVTVLQLLVFIWNPDNLTYTVI